MNSVMDDNKILTLINGERIAMPEQVSLLFEVEDLAVASPATVSRCGMVYADYADIGWQPYVDSWLEKKKDNKVCYQRNVDIFLCRLQSIAAHRDYFVGRLSVRRLSVRLCVCLSGSRHMHSSECCHYVYTSVS